MKIRSARQFGRVSTTALACALVAATVPAFAAQGAASPKRVKANGGLILADDAYVLNAGDALLIVEPGVLTNDSHPGRDVSRVVSLVAGPSHGSLALAKDGGFEYMPARGFAGTDGFRYGVTADGAYGEANVTLSVTSPVDLGLSVAAPATAGLGAPVTFTFTVANESLADADNVELLVRLQGAHGAGGSDGFGSSRGDCTSIPTSGLDASWTCRPGRISGGASYQVSFMMTSEQARVLHASAQVVASQPDSDPADNGAAAETLVGRVWTNPGQVSHRLPWRNATLGAAVEISLVNATPSAMSYETQAGDRVARDVVPAWFSVTPNSGSVDSDSSQVLTVSFATENETPGLKRGIIHFTHDSAFELADVPVSFTVAFLDMDAGRHDDTYVHALAGAGITAGCQEGRFCPDQPLSRAGSTVWLLLGREGRDYEPAAPEGIFLDVVLDRPEAAFIEDLARRGVAAGCDGDNFCPDVPLARADAAVMVVKMLEGVRYQPAVNEGRPMFRDMRDDPRAAWVEDAVRRGIFSACSAGPRFFCPDQPLTRGDAAVTIVKAFNLPLF